MTTLILFLTANPLEPMLNAMFLPFGPPLRNKADIRWDFYWAALAEMPARPPAILSRNCAMLSSSIVAPLNTMKRYYFTYNRFVALPVMILDSSQSSYSIKA